MTNIGTKMFRTAKDYAIRWLRRLLASREYELIPRWRLDDLPLERHLDRILERFGIECVLDVGGSMGQTAARLRMHQAYTGRIITFEPVPKHIDLLRRRSADDDSWEIVECALGRHAGHAEINVSRSPGNSSFLMPSNRVVTGYWREGDMLGTETVEIRRLDDVVGSLGLDVHETPTLLKVDTQGFDLEVLEGAGRVLPMIRAVQIEGFVRPIYEGSPSYLETIRYLTDRDFQLSGLFPVTVDASLRLQTIDCIFINSRFNLGT